MTLSPEATRFVPLVKNIALKMRPAIGPEMEEQDLVNFGLEGLSQGLAQYKSRQGLTQRDFLTYKVRAAIFAGLNTYTWPTEESRQKYMFLKKTNEFLLNFHLSAESAIKRSIKAEEAEILQLLKILATIGLLCGTKRSIDAERLIIIRELQPVEQEFIRLYYEQDLDLRSVSEKIKLSEAATFRFHLKILEQLVDKFSELAADEV